MNDPTRRNDVRAPVPRDKANDHTHGKCDEARQDQEAP